MADFPPVCDDLPTAPTSSPPPVAVEQLRGFKQLRRVAGLLSFLHDSGCGRDKADNRELHFDDYERMKDERMKGT